MRNGERFARAVRWTALVSAALLVAIASLTLIPPFSMAMIAVRICATEGGAWLLAVAVIVSITALIPGGLRRVRAATGILALCAGVLVSLPMSRIPATIASADAALARACGASWIDEIPADIRLEMRPHAVLARDAFLGIAPGPVVETPLLVPAADGQVLRAMRYQGMSSARGQAVVVAIHGGGWSGGAITEGAVCHRYLAAHGYLVFSIDYRCAPAVRFPGQLADVRFALAWVVHTAADFGGDPSRLVLIGRSAGAELAMVAAYAHPDPSIRAVVSWYGPVDLAGGYREPPRPDPLRVRSLLSDYLGGTPDDQPELYERASPITYADRRQPPTLLISGAGDHGVLISFQRRLRDRLVASGSTAALIELPWAEHAFDRIPNGPGAQISLFYIERFVAWAVAR